MFFWGTMCFLSIWMERRMTYPVDLPEASIMKEECTNHDGGVVRSDVEEELLIGSCLLLQ